jgi:hypothetical protein
MINFLKHKPFKFILFHTFVSISFLLLPLGYHRTKHLNIPSYAQTWWDSSELMTSLTHSLIHSFIHSDNFAVLRIQPMVCHKISEVLYCWATTQPDFIYRNSKIQVLKPTQKKFIQKYYKNKSFLVVVSYLCFEFLLIALLRYQW